MNAKKQYGQKGFALLEFILVIVIVAILAGLAAITYNQLTGDSRVGTAAQQAIAMKTKISGYYARAVDYSTLTFDVVRDAGLADDTMLIRDAGGGVVQVRDAFGVQWDAANVAPNGGNINFQVTFPEVPVSNCSSFVERLAATFRSILVGGIVVQNLLPGQNQGLDLAALSTACNPQGVSSIDVVLIDR